MFSLPVTVYVALLALAIMAAGMAHAHSNKQPINGYYLTTVTLIIAAVILNSLSPYRIQGSNGEQIAMYERCMTAVPMNKRTVEAMNLCQNLVKIVSSTPATPAQ